MNQILINYAKPSDFKAGDTGAKCYLIAWFKQEIEYTEYSLDDYQVRFNYTDTKIYIKASLKDGTV